jgi:hypothetical protein
MSRQDNDAAAVAHLDRHPRPAPGGHVEVPEDFKVFRPKRVRPWKVAKPQKGAPSRIGNYHKGLQHDAFGEVVEASYQSLLSALQHPTQANFEAIQLGGPRKLVNPQAGLANDVEGPDPESLTIPAPPAVDSAEAAAEAVELYWMALLRDVPFSDWATDPRIAQAAAELSGLQDFTGPKAGGAVTPATIFRGFTPGDLQGPYLSQFMVKELPAGSMSFPYGSLSISQKQQTVVPGVDYLTDFATWLDIQNGALPASGDQFDPTRRHIRSMRDLGQYVHVDALYEAYLNACLMLLALGAPFDEGNPYNDSATQIGFGTFGGPHVLSLVTEVATRALKAVWWQKWFAWRRLRPEAYGGLVHLEKTGQKDYPLHPQVLSSQAVAQTFAQNGTYLMPMAFPEGSPTHPAYGAGHATVAGACVTILKAFFDEDWQLPDPVQPSADGLSLVPYTGAPLTVGGELNKVAANVAIGRNMAGVHWRTDYTASVELGERVAVCILLKQRKDYNEDWSFSFTRFNGQRVTLNRQGIFDEDGKPVAWKC